MPGPLNGRRSREWARQSPADSSPRAPYVPERTARRAHSRRRARGPHAASPAEPPRAFRSKGPPIPAESGLRSRLGGRPARAGQPELASAKLPTTSMAESRGTRGLLTERRDRAHRQHRDSCAGEEDHEASARRVPLRLEYACAVCVRCDEGGIACSPYHERAVESTGHEEPSLRRERHCADRIHVSREHAQVRSVLHVPQTHGDVECAARQHLMGARRPLYRVRQGRVPREHDDPDSAVVRTRCSWSANTRTTSPAATLQAISRESPSPVASSSPSGEN